MEHKERFSDPELERVLWDPVVPVTAEAVASARLRAADKALDRWVEAAHNDTKEDDDRAEWYWELAARLTKRALEALDDDRKDTR